ncbi:MAG: hypothetical protein AYK19_08110 [Theionarchaea archaeon DG-70-1]|nr:MAG: hypothetical protein AYK19_08110 [Theionarchaea archaeon DG-70-1]
MLALLFGAYSHRIWGWEDVEIQPQYIYTPEGHKTNIHTLSRSSILERHKWIVVYSPHPDDETLGLGATIHYYKRMGFKILVVVLTHGEGSIAREILCDLYGFCFSEKEFGLLRVEEFKAAMVTLGVYHAVYDFGDQNLEEEKIKRIILYYDRNLDVAYHFVTASESGFNPDHVVTSVALKNVNVRGGKAEFGVYALYYTQIDIHGRIIINADIKDLICKRDALYQYRYWNPAEERYSIGYLTFPELWDLLYSKYEFEIILIITDKDWEEVNKRKTGKHSSF